MSKDVKESSPECGTGSANALTRDVPGRATEGPLWLNRGSKEERKEYALREAMKDHIAKTVAFTLSEIGRHWKTSSEFRWNFFFWLKSSL